MARSRTQTIEVPRSKVTATRAFTFGLAKSIVDARDPLRRLGEIDDGDNAMDVQNAS
jgi:hypothetical protein